MRLEPSTITERGHDRGPFATPPYFPEAGASFLLPLLFFLRPIKDTGAPCADASARSVAKPRPSSGAV
jgi:hypothetical protein